MDLPTMSSRTPSTSSSSPRPLKKENEEEIKEFAETAMNELLGWYGYERLELRRWAAARKEAASPEQAEAKDKDECAWCAKPAPGSPLQHAGAAFCSELCFSQSRRANFKRAKTCDWCRHVRHTVAYVDFQDGATQLQFCSDKCLNQYKMHIFCRETQAHLDLNPHLASAASASSLITPDLWLKNCRSRSASPNSEKSSETAKEMDTSKSPLPLITVAPTAKLMKKSEDKKERKDPRKMSLRKRKCPATVTSQSRKFKPPEKSPESSPVSNATALHSPPQQFSFGVPPFLDNAPEPRIPMFHPRANYVRPPPPMERPRPYFQHPLGQVPPVTVMVPYPVVIPVPIPIPVPLPMTAFLQAHLSRVKTEAKSDEGEGPLDFTMNGDKKKESETQAPTEPEERVTQESSPEQTLPKFKITRVGKLPKLIARSRDQSESSRPLRKRRRLVESASDEDAMKTRKIVQV